MKKLFTILTIASLFAVGCNSNPTEPVKESEEPIVEEVTTPPVEGQQVTVVEDEDGNIVAAASSVPMQTVKESDIVEEVEVPADEAK